VSKAGAAIGSRRRVLASAAGRSLQERPLQDWLVTAQASKRARKAA